MLLRKTYWRERRLIEYYVISAQLAYLLLMSYFIQYNEHAFGKVVTLWNCMHWYPAYFLHSFLGCQSGVTCFLSSNTYGGLAYSSLVHMQECCLTCNVFHKLCGVTLRQSPCSYIPCLSCYALHNALQSAKTIRIYNNLYYFCCKCTYFLRCIYHLFRRLVTLDWLVSN